MSVFVSISPVDMPSLLRMRRDHHKLLLKILYKPLGLPPPNMPCYVNRYEDINDEGEKQVKK